jgi:hypothetical protein
MDDKITRSTGGSNGNSYSGETAQDWLQKRYIEAYAHARRRLKNCAAIAGWGTMNEPHPGFIGYTNLNNLENNMVAIGPMPSAFAAMAAASGHHVEVPVYTTGITGVRHKGRAVLNPEGVSVFKEGFICPWKAAGVWGDGADGPLLLKPDHFAFYNGNAGSKNRGNESAVNENGGNGRPGNARRVRFAEDFLAPFTARFMRRLSEADEKTFFFIEGVPAGLSTGDDAVPVPDEAAGRMVHGFHWYDGPTMYLKQFRPWFNFNVKTGKIVLGKKSAAALFREQIAEHILPDMPNLVGEFGIPFDLFKGRAFTSGDYSAHEEALAMYYDALDELLLGCCIWDYSADNTFLRGDSWNNEDFSIVTTGGGGPLRPRAEGGWLRPYPLAIAGIPLSFMWNRKKKSFTCRYRAAPAISAPTAFFVPAGLWDTSPVITAEGSGQASVGLQTEYRPEEQALFVYHDGFDGEVCVTVR